MRWPTSPPSTSRRSIPGPPGRPASSLPRSLLAAGILLAGASIWVALISRYRLLFHAGATELTVLETSSRGLAEDLIEALNIAIVERQ
jgi:hypothetical protein